MNARRSALRTAGAVALAAATHQMATGVRGVRGADAPRPAVVGDRSVDSELRFYAAWYGVAGAAMVMASRDSEADRVLAPLLASGWAASAGARLLSLRAVGRPDPLFLALAGVEAALAAVLVATRESARV